MVFALSILGIFKFFTPALLFLRTLNAYREFGGGTGWAVMGAGRGVERKRTRSFVSVGVAISKLPSL